MNTNEKGESPETTTTTTTVTVNGYVKGAQERVQDVRRVREQIPRLIIPPTADALQKMSGPAAISPEFIELTNMAVANDVALVRGDGATPAEIRDLVAYADAYSPLADELEALAHFVRHSVTAARYKAATEALTTYAIASRLAKLPETARLAPHVADMRRALGRTRKSTPEERAERARKAAERAAERAAKAAPRSSSNE